MAKVNSDTSPLIITSHPDVAKCIARYPAWVQEKLARLRSLILTVAEETEGISQLEETLKWGEPSYLVKKGSTELPPIHRTTEGGFIIDSKEQISQLWNSQFLLR